MSEKAKKSRDKYPPLTTPPDPPVPNRAHTEMALGNFKPEDGQAVKGGKHTEGNFGK
ncbi:MAG: hypothetical protein IJA78_03625 [Clostridia bacterium]|nr:hypothetical protein [Clostridia bacterium]